MALNIEDPVTEQLVHELAQFTGETLDDAMRLALEERLERIRSVSKKKDLAEGLREIRLRWKALPILDPRNPDDIVGFDDSGVPRGW